MNYESNIDFLNLNSFRFHYFGHQECDPNHTYGPEVRNEYMLKFVKKGMGVYRINNSSYKIKEHTCFMVFPGEVTYYKADHNFPWEYFWFSFSGEKAQDFLSKSGITSQNPIIQIKNLEYIETLFEHIRNKKIKKDSVDELFYTGLFSQILSELFRTSGYSEVITVNNIKTHNNSFIKEAVNYINLNYTKDISVTYVADHVGLERAYFSKLFKETKGISPIEYLTEIRLKSAKSLLINSKMSVKSIALASGFKDIYYFSQAFKKITGVSPLEYRNQQQVVP